MQLVGDIYINDNALGCNSGDEIIAAVPHTIMLTSSHRWR